MPRLQRRSFVDPGETRRFPNGALRTVALDETVFGEYSFEPGWKWSRDVKPIVGTAYCQQHHVGYAVRGHLRITMPDGTVLDIHAGDAYEIPPGHDGEVVGDEPYLGIEFTGARTFAVAPESL